MLSRACAESRSLCGRAGLQAAAGRDGAAAGEDPRRADQRGRVLVLAGHPVLDQPRCAAAARSERAARTEAAPVVECLPPVLERRGALCLRRTAVAMQSLLLTGLGRAVAVARLLESCAKRLAKLRSGPILMSSCFEALLAEGCSTTCLLLCDLPHFMQQIAWLCYRRACEGRRLCGGGRELPRQHGLRP